MPAVAPSHSDSEDSNTASKSKAKAIQGDPESEDEGASEEVTEYEIEEVLDAKRGYFPDGRMGYFVKWKGYGPDDNSWVDEQDAVNAKDLVNEYWRKNPNKNRGGTSRKSIDKKSPKKARMSAATDDVSEVDEGSTTKKRGRKSVSQKLESNDDMDVDELVEKPSKKAKTSSTQPTKAKAKNRPATPEVEEEVIGSMKEYMHVKDWEGLVKTVDTVEKEKDGRKLIVFFSLHSGEKVRENSTICKERFPQKMLEFYESNLRWREAQDVDSD